MEKHKTFSPGEKKMRKSVDGKRGKAQILSHLAQICPAVPSLKGVVPRQAAFPQGKRGRRA